MVIGIDTTLRICKGFPVSALTGSTSICISLLASATEPISWFVDAFLVPFGLVGLQRYCLQPEDEREGREHLRGGESG